MEAKRELDNCINSNTESFQNYKPNNVIESSENNIKLDDISVSITFNIVNSKRAPINTSKTILKKSILSSPNNSLVKSIERNVRKLLFYLNKNLKEVVKKNIL